MVHLHPTLHLLEPLQMLRLAVVYFDRELKKDFCVSEENFHLYCKVQKSSRACLNLNMFCISSPKWVWLIQNGLEADSINGLLPLSHQCTLY